MSTAVISEVNKRLRALGFVVHEAPGWSTRGNGHASAYEGGLIHHTATAFDVALPGSGIYNLLVNGRGQPNPLSGPLCNYAGNSDGSFTCIAAHPANHAGASGGRSMGPLPTTKLFNRLVLGLEIVYPGTSPMRTVQYKAAVAWGRVVADVVGRGDVQRVRAHAETSVTGKWDPGVAPSRTMDMGAYRNAILDYRGGVDVQNLIIAHATGQAQHWVGNGIVRRKIANQADLEGLQHWIRQRGGNGDIAVIDSLDAVLGPEAPASVPVELDYDRFVNDVVARLKDEIRGTLTTSWIPAD